MFQVEILRFSGISLCLRRNHSFLTWFRYIMFEMIVTFEAAPWFRHVWIGSIANLRDSTTLRLYKIKTVYYRQHTRNYRLQESLSPSKQFYDFAMFALEALPFPEIPLRWSYKVKKLYYRLQTRNYCLKAVGYELIIGIFYREAIAYRLQAGSNDWRLEVI